MKNPSTYSNYLQELMAKVGIFSLSELSTLSGISEWQLWRLEAGLLPRIEVQLLLKLSQILQISVIEIIEKFYPESLLKDEILKSNYISDQSPNIKQEYLNIQQQLENQKEILENQFQQQTLQILESYLIQFPTVIATIEKKPDLPAKNLIPVIKQIEKLLEKWNIQAIESVGDQVNYNPQIHQLMEGKAEIGDQVKVRYVGYIQGEKLLYRAKVSPI